MFYYRRISVSFYYCSLSRRSAKRCRLPSWLACTVPTICARRSSAKYVCQIHESWESGLITMCRIYAHEIIILAYQMIFICTYMSIACWRVDEWLSVWNFRFFLSIKPGSEGGILSKFIGQRRWFARLYRSLEYRVYL